MIVLELHKVKTGKRKFGNKPKNFRSKNPSKSFRNSNPKQEFRRDKQRPEPYMAICDTCKQKCEIPFKPKYDFPVYCSDCFRKLKSKGSDFSEDVHPKRFDRINKERYRQNSKKERSQKKIEDIYAGGSEKFYTTLREKLFEILGGKVCSTCGFKDERALGFRQIHEEAFDPIQRGGFASSWHKYISDPDLARNELRILCLNCNEIRKTISPPKEKFNPKKNKRFPR